MFRYDYLTIKRDEYALFRGEAIHSEKTIAKGIPCHLSLSLNEVINELNTPQIKSSHVLFLDYDPSLDIKENDKLIVETSKGKTYILYAGEVLFYNLSIQVRCRQERVLES